MTRRLRIASTAFGAMLGPACAGFQPDPPMIKPVNPRELQRVLAELPHGSLGGH